MTSFTWTGAAGDNNWFTAANWAPSGGPPTAGDDATIALAGTTVDIFSAASIHSLTLNASGATVDLRGTLSLGGTLTLSAGTFALGSGGVVSGGTIVGSGLVYNGGTLSGVTFDGLVDLSATNADLHVTNGITLTGTGGTGPGSLQLTGAGSHLYLDGTQTLDNAGINIGNSGSYDVLRVQNGAVTLGSQLSIAQTGHYAAVPISNATLVNQGTIAAGYTNGRFALQSYGTFVNQGLLSITNGDNAYVRSGLTIFNQGTIALGSGGKLHLAGQFSESQLGSVSNIGGTILIDGTLDNTGAVLQTGSGGIGTVALDSNGLITGGTITGSTMLFNGGTLSGVTFDGPLDLSASNPNLHITNGVTLTGTGGSGAGSVLLTGANARLYLPGTQTLDNAALSIGNSNNYDLLFAQNGVLMLGSQLSMSQAGRYAALSISNATLVNQGTISAGYTSGRFVFESYGTFVNQGVLSITNGDNAYIRSGLAFSNQGSIALASGGRLHLAGVFTEGQFGTFSNTGGTVFIDGTLDNTGAVLQTGTGGFGTVALDSNGVIVSGTVTGGGMLFNSGTFSGVTYAGPIDMSASGANLHVTNGITLTGTSGTGPGSVLLSGFSARLYLAGSQTLDNATISIGNLSTYSFLDTRSGAVTLGPQLSVMQTGRYVQAPVIGATLINQGTITAGYTTGRFAFLGYGTLVNQNVISITNGDAFYARSVNFTNAVGASVEVGAGSKLFLGNPGFAFSNQGTIDLGVGAALHLGGNFTENQLGAFTNSGGTIFINGTLDNTGAVLQTGSSGIGAVVLKYGAIVNGTVTGGGIEFKNNDTLSGVTYAGPLGLSATGDSVNITNGITLTGTGGTGPGSVLLTGFGSTLYLIGSQTLDNAAISIGNKYAVASLRAQGGGAVTLGPQLSLTQTGRFAQLLVSSFGNTTLVNQGTIIAGYSTGSFVFGGYSSFINQGLISVANGDHLVAQSVNFTNAVAASVSVGANSALYLGSAYQTFDSQGSISLGSGAGLHLRGSFNAASLGTLTNSGGTVFINGTLDNTGAVLQTGTPGIGSAELDSLGVIVGGTVAGGAMRFAAGTLSGVTYAGPIDLSGSGERLHITNGISLTGTGGSGPGSILMTGGGATLYLYGTQTIDNATLSVGNASFNNLNVRGADTFGPQLAVMQAGREFIASVFGGATLVNQGTFTAAYTSGRLYLQTYGSFINQGGITIANAELFDARQVDFTNAAGASISVGSGSDLRLGFSFGGRSAINQGTIAVASGGVIQTSGVVELDPTGIIAGGTVIGVGVVLSGGTLSGVTDETLLNLAPDGAQVHVTNGITLTGTGGAGTGTALLTGANAELLFGNSETIDSAALTFGNNTTADVLAETGTGATLVLGPALTITQTGQLGQIVNQDTSDTIVNQGTIEVTAAAGQLTVSGGTFVNQGSIGLGSGMTLRLAATIVDPGLTGVSNAGGTIFIDGTLENTGGLLQTGTAGIGTVVLDPTGVVSSGTVAGGGLVASAGTLAGVTYQGLLDLSADGAQLTVANGITLTGAGGVGSASVLLTGSASHLSMAGSETLTNAAMSLGNDLGSPVLAETGTAATLTLGPGLAITQTGLNALIVNSDHTDAIVNQGSITAALANGHLTISGGSFVNQGSVGVSGGGILDATGTDLNNAAGGTLSVGDGSEASANLLHNGGAVLVGGGGITSTTVLSAASLVNSGSITISGNSASGGGRAELLIGGSGDDTGSIVLGGNASLSAGSQLHVSSGGNVTVSAGGTADSLEVGAAGTVVVSTGGTVFGASVGSGGFVDVLSGGTALGSLLRGGSQTVENGGSASGTEILSGGSETVSGVDLGGTIAGGTQTIAVGGTAVSAVVSPFVFSPSPLVLVSGLQEVFGTASASTVDGFAVLVVESGGLASGTRMIADTVLGEPLGQLDVLSGGTALASFLSGDSATIEAGGTASGTLILSGAVETVSGFETGATVSSGGTQTVAPGGLASNTTVSGFQNVFGTGSSSIIASGGVVDVGSGGTALGALLSGGNETVESGGTDSGAVVDAGSLQAVFGSATSALVFGQQAVESAGSVSGTVVISGGLLDVLSGGTAFATLISGGGGQTVETGGSASGTQILLGGSETVFGFDSAATISAGGVQTISAGGTANGATVSGGDLIVSAGGLASGTTILAGGSETVSGLDLQATISGGGVQTIGAGGTAIDASVDGAVSGLQDVFGLASGTNISAGGVVDVEAGGTALGATVGSGGSIDVLSGGLASGAVISTGGSETVLDSDSGAQLRGGSETVSSGGVATSDTVSAGTLTASISGIASGATILSGGSAIVSSGGSTVSAIVSAGGLETVLAGGVTTGTTLSGSSTASGVEVLSGGIASGTTVSAGGKLVIRGGTASDTTVFASGTEVVSAGGITTATILSGNSPISSGSIAAQETVSSGGTSLATTISSGGRITISSGGLTSATVVSSGGVEVATNGGLASSTVVVSAGTQFLSSGGTALATTVSSGGAQNIALGGTALNATLSAGGVQNVSSGGLASATTVSSSGHLNVLSGGLESGSVILGGGVEVVSAGGIGSSTRATSGGLLIVSAGGQTIGALVEAIGSNGGGDEILRGGTASNTTVSSGGFLIVSGGVASGATLVSGGQATVSSGGATVGALITGGGTGVAQATETVSSGGTALATTVSAGAQLVVSAGGLASGGTIFDSGNAFASSGGVISNLTLLSGGQIFVSAGGITVSSLLSGHGSIAATEQVIGGTASSSMVSSGAIQSVASGGVDSGAMIFNGATDDIRAGGTAIGTLLSGGLMNVSSGGTAIGTTVSALGVLNVFSGAITSNTVIDSGASETVFGSGALGGGTAFFTTATSGGAIIVSAGGVTVSSLLIGSGAVPATEFLSGGEASATTVSSGGELSVAGSGVALNTSAVSGGQVFVSAGGTESGGQVSAGGGETVLLSGTASGTTIGSGGMLTAGGTASNVTVAASGLEVVSAGGIDISATLSGGEQDVFGTASGVAVAPGGLQLVESGGQASGTVVSAGGSETVLGLDTGATINGGGAQIVEAGGTAIGASIDGASSGLQDVFGTASASTVSGGGVLDVESGGTAAGATVLSGGLLDVLSGGSANASLLRGGQESVEAGGSESSATVSANGLVNVYGTATSDTVNAGGNATVQSGGSAAATMLAGGTESVAGGGTIIDPTISGTGAVLTVSSGANVSSAVTFAGSGGQLQLAGNLTAGILIDGATVSGLVPGDTLDLLNVAFDPSGDATLIVSSGSVQNQLQITEGGSTYDLQLDTTQSFAGDFFHLTSDGTGGTLVFENNNPCYCRGTLILTNHGEVAVEDLAIGDRVITLTGEARAIKWIGHRAYDGRFIRGQRAILPIRVAAGAIAEGLPVRDLWISPEHALYLDGVLVAARLLLNGITIVQPLEADHVEYFHVELETHDIVIAEGVPAESYVECDNRGMFQNAGEFEALYPDNRREPAQFCASRIEEGAVELAGIRAALLDRAAALGWPTAGSEAPTRHRMASSIVC